MFHRPWRGFRGRTGQTNELCLMGRFNHRSFSMGKTLISWDVYITVARPWQSKNHREKTAQKNGETGYLFFVHGRQINKPCLMGTLINSPCASWEHLFINNGASRSLSAHLRHSGETPRSGSVCAYFQRGHI